MGNKSELKRNIRLQSMIEHEWGKEAFDRFPELRDRFDAVDSPYLLWIELTLAFKQAYQTPRNEDLIARIYAYADWCCSQPEGDTAENDLGTCVCACFYEHIPESTEALEDMPRFFSRADVLTMKPTFSYMVGEGGFQKILGVFARHHRQQKRLHRQQKKLRRQTRG